MAPGCIGVAIAYIHRLPPSSVNGASITQITNNYGTFPNCGRNGAFAREDVRGLNTSRATIR